MPSDTECLLHVRSSRTYAASRILAPRYRLQMIRIDATSYSTKMIEFKPFRNRTKLLFVQNFMYDGCLFGMPAASYLRITVTTH
jgi:hypothetical protein